MTLTPVELDKLARLAHLELTADERRRLTRDLNAIVEFVDRIKAAEDPKTVPVVPAPSLRLAEDRVRPSLVREAGLAAAPTHSVSAVVAPPLEAADGP